MNKKFRARFDFSGRKPTILIPSNYALIKPGAKLQRGDYLIKKSQNIRKKVDIPQSIPETKDRTKFINEVYKIAFGSKPDSYSLRYWLKRLATKKISKKHNLQPATLKDIFNWGIGHAKNINAEIEAENSKICWTPSFVKNEDQEARAGKEYHYIRRL